jgi:hypothetical protein
LARRKRRVAVLNRLGLAREPLQIITFRSVPARLLTFALWVIFALCIPFACASLLPTNGRITNVMYGTTGAFVTRMGVSVAFAVAAMMAATGAASPGWPRPRLSLAVTAFVAMLFLVGMLQRASSPGANGIGTTQAALTKAVCAFGMVAVFALPFVSLAPKDNEPRLVLSAAPYITWVLGLLTSGKLGASWHSLHDYRVDQLTPLLPNLALLLALYLWWNLIQWSQFITTLAARGVGLVQSRIPEIALALVTAKILWLVLGLTAKLPAILGGSSDTWDRSRSQGAAAWGEAIVLAAIAFVFIVRNVDRPTPSRKTPHEPIGPGLAIVAALLFSPSIVAAVTATTMPALWAFGADSQLGLMTLCIAAALGLVVGRAYRAGKWPSGTTRIWVATAGLMCAAMYLTDLAGVGHLHWETSYNTWPTTVAAYYFIAPVLAAVYLLSTLLSQLSARLRPIRFLRMPLWGSIPFLLILVPVIALHVVPILSQIPLRLDQGALGASGDILLTPEKANIAYPVHEAHMPGWGIAGIVQPLSVDFGLTLLLVAFLLRAARTGNVKAVEGGLRWVLILTIFANGRVLAPTGWLGHFWFYAAFVFPVFYQFAYNARDLNRSGTNRHAIVLALVAGVLALLTISAYRLAVGSLPSAPALKDQVFGYGRGITLDFYAMPLTFVVAVWTHRMPDAATDGARRAAAGQGGRRPAGGRRRRVRHPPAGRNATAK